MTRTVEKANFQPGAAEQCADGIGSIAGVAV